ncbi:MAG: DUF7619 domain-containing protein [Saprospiraceae bacterium]
MKTRPAPRTFHIAIVQAAGWLLLFMLQWILFPTAASGQGWQFTYGGEKTDEGWAVLQTEDHGFVVAGFGESFGDDNDQDIFILRTDVDGRILWTVFFDEGYQEQPRSVLLTPDGNFLIVGTISNQIGANEDIYLLKINRKGEKLWSKQFGSPNIERVSSAVVRPDGSIAVAGFVRRNNEDEDMLLAVFDPLGDIRWLKNYGTSRPDEATSLALLPQGDMLLAGNSRNEKGFDNDIVLFRVDSTGTVVWEKRIGNPYREEVRDVLLTKSGNIAIAGTINDNSDAYVAVFDLQGNRLWEKTIGETGKEEEANAIAELASGNLVITGLKLTDMVNVDVFIAQLSNDGNILWEKNIGDKTATEEGRDIQPTADGGFIITGYNAQVLTSFNDLILIKTDGLGAVVSNYLSGKVFWDEDGQCDLDASERPLSGWLVQAESARGVFYGTTDDHGFYRIAVDTGQYVLRALPLNLYWEACNFQGRQVAFKAFYDSLRVDFPMKPSVLCPFLEVEVATPFLAICEDLEYTVSYCNIGTARAENAYVDLQLDPRITFQSANLQHVLLPDGKRRFLLGNLAPAACGRFVVKAKMACSGIAEGQAALVSARIYPDTSCLKPSPDWDLASLSVQGSCEGDSVVVFQIRNDGVGDMRSAKRSIVIQDNIVLRQLDIQLKATEEQRVRIPANGATFRAVVEQSTGHPGRSYPTAAVEGCVAAGSAFTTGKVTMFPENELDPNIGIDVQEILALPQAIDIRGYPKGYKDSIIAPETDLTFKVLFKNTGRDTVTRIVIRDTLPGGLDPRKVVAGPSSLPYRLEVFGNGIVRITMDSVVLPPVTAAGRGTGFVEFKVGQRNDNPLPTVLQNRATVFFNDQAPQTTRTLRYVVEQFPDFITVLTSTKEVFFPGVSVSAYPNPSPGSVTFNVEGMPFQSLRLSVFTADGRLVQQQFFSGNAFVWNRNTLSGGLYLYRLENENGKLINTGKLILR